MPHEVCKAGFIHDPGLMFASLSVRSTRTRTMCTHTALHKSLRNGTCASHVADITPSVSPAIGVKNPAREESCAIK